MQFGGDIERLLAWLYPNRVPIGMALAALTIAAALVGYRRGWHHAGLRHPRASLVIGLLVLALGSPVAWILGSPLIVRTELLEAAPTGEGTAAVAPSTPGAPPSGAGGPTSSAALPSSAPRPSPAPFVARTFARGRFAGADDFHYGSGFARVLETTPGRFVLRFEDFSVRNGPDLYVYLSPDRSGYADGAIELGTLKATDGSFNYAIPSGTDLRTLGSAVIWCKAFSVQFAHAPLER
jgi:hypothetical protein